MNFLNFINWTSSFQILGLSVVFFIIMQCFRAFSRRVPENLVRLVLYCLPMSDKKDPRVKMYQYESLKNHISSDFISLPDVVLILLINVKMPTIVGTLTFMGWIDFMIG